MSRMTGARVLIESLNKEGIQHVFGLPGGQCIPIFDALYDAKFKVVLVLQDSKAAMLTLLADQVQTVRVIMAM